MENLNNPDWRLETLDIRFNDYGDFKGKYTGRVKFQNKQQEAFMFNLRSDQAEEYLRLIKGELVGAASGLGDKLLHSLNLLPPPEEKKQIGEIIEHEEMTA